MKGRMKGARWFEAAVLSNVPSVARPVVSKRCFAISGGPSSEDGLQFDVRVRR